MAKPKNTSTFIYTNPHPNGDKNLSDCVYRAIAIATGKTWLQVYDELTLLGRELLAPANDDKTWSAYLTKIGEKIEAKYEKSGRRFRHTPKTLPKKGTYVMSQAHHLVTIVDGKTRDTWDSSNRSAYTVWKIS